jgi:shikimate dehydrogenase
MRISGKTKTCGLIGDPVEHSLSPFLHNAAFQHLGLDFVYVVFTVTKKHLGNAISGVRSLGFRGLNVTMPHKVSVVQYLDELDETAKNIGSVNTILNQNGKLTGFTTDGIGALKALKFHGADPSGKKIIVLGAGGASRSVSFTLAKEARELVILNRTLMKAQKLVGDLSAHLGPRAKVRAGELNSRNISKELMDADVLVNATSVGMHPQESLSPVTASLLRSDLVVFDLVYEPIETKLLVDAKRKGAMTVDGLSMLVFQGAVSFEIWTGVKAPVEVMMNAAVEELQARQH